MRNRIIALALTVVMVVLALASCSSGYNYTENISSYTEIKDKEGFKNALASIVIEDEYFTGDETIRGQKVENKIYEALSDYATKNGEKKESGAFDMNDVLYYAYYTSYTKDGKTYNFGMDKVSSTSSPSNIKLGAFDVDEKSADKLSVAIKEAIEKLDDKTITAYKAVSTKNTNIKDSDNKIIYNTIFISYTVTYVVDDTTNTEKAKYEMLDLTDTDNELVKLISGEKTTAKVGNNISVKVDTTDKDGKPATKEETEHKLTIDGVEYTFKNINIVSAVKEEMKTLVEFNYAPYTTEQKLTPDSRYTTETSAKVTIPKDAELTYYVYPVYFYEVTNEINATAVLKEALGSSITATSLEIFENEDYKASYTDNSNKDKPVTSDKTLKELINILVDIHSSTSKTDYEAAIKTAKSDMDAKKIKYDAAAKIVTDKGDKATADEIKARDDAKAAYDEAVKAHEEAEDQKDTDIDNVIKSIVAAKSTKADAKPIEEVIVDEYKESKYETLEEEYEKAIIDKIGKELWKIIQKHVTVNGYPEELMESSVAQLTNNYEYQFYTGTVTKEEDPSAVDQSRYTYYGSFDNYLVKTLGATSKADIDAKLKAEAQKSLKPILQIYAAAEFLKNDAKGFKAQVEKTKFLYEDNEAYFEFALVMAESFMITDEVLEAYEEFAGDIGYDSMIDNYGEENLRTALQAQTLFDYLLYVNRTKVEGADHDSHSHDRVEYEYKDNKINFLNITYSIKEDAKDDSEND